MTPDTQGTHLTPFERALGRYLLSVPHSGLTSLADLASASVEHEPYYVNDSGTSWPEDTTVVYYFFGAQVRKNGTRGVSRKKRTVSAASYSPVEFMRILLDDFSGESA